MAAMRVLLHICCAPCALMPVDSLRAEGLELMGLFYNPNIQPYQESRRRLEALTGWAGATGLDLIVQDEYELEAWLRRAAFRETERCRFCHHQRLLRAAQVARRGGFDAFSTTLLYSVRQKHELVREMAEAAAAETGVAFIHRDWRPRWQEGQAESRRLGLYRQAYCGCIYSERDRYLGAPGRAPATKAKGR
ncbi:MAG: epoxyqueuosine reductase QueH [Thermodesulfobacteriota bacterium]